MRRRYVLNGGARVGALVLAGCNTVLGLDPTTYRHDAAPIDAPGCAGAEFGTPTIIAEADAAPFEPQLGPDLLEAWFIQLGSPTNIYRATRASTAERFGAATLAAFSDAGTNTAPALTGDGLRMLFVSSRLGGTNAVFEATRAALGAEFGPPAPVTGLAGHAIVSIDVSFDGRTLYVMDRDGTIHAASRPSFGEPFGPGTVVAAEAGYASVSPDGLELFSNPRAAPYSVRHHVRTAPDATFSTETRVILDGGEDPDLAPDGATLVATLGAQLVALERPCP